MLLSTIDILESILGSRPRSGSRRAAFNSLLVDVFLLDLQIVLGHQFLRRQSTKKYKIQLVKALRVECLINLPHKVL